MKLRYTVQAARWRNHIEIRLLLLESKLEALKYKKCRVHLSTIKHPIRYSRWI